ncbi:MAG: hypothetical protein JWQ98_449 [Chlorobi bacterium]|nr:hypothetical protein [Chlorobiota bacterium]
MTAKNILSAALVAALSLGTVAFAQNKPAKPAKTTVQAAPKEDGAMTPKKKIARKRHAVRKHKAQTAATAPASK